MLGRGGGRPVVSVLALCSDKSSLSPAWVWISGKIVVEKNENEQKEFGVGPFSLKSPKANTGFGNSSTLSFVSSSCNILKGRVLYATFYNSKKKLIAELNQ